MFSYQLPSAIQFHPNLLATKQRMAAINCDGPRPLTSFAWLDLNLRFEYRRFLLNVEDVDGLGDTFEVKDQATLPSFRGQYGPCLSGPEM